MSAISIQNVTFAYNSRPALNDLTLDIPEGKLFGLLGPNGSGKTTLFRILSTLLPLQQGSITILGHQLSSEPDLVRRLLGVTFQSPSLDGKLTVDENLLHQSRLYGLNSHERKQRIDEVLVELGISDRRKDRVETLSGGLKRRVEIAKSLLHRPRLLLLDEPSTGLDPSARIDLWRFLDVIRQTGETTIVLSTHLMEEADRCDTLGLLSQGELIAQGRPDDLKSSLGSRFITIKTADLEQLAGEILAKFDVEVRMLPDQLRIEHAQAESLLTPLVETFGPRITQLTLGTPTLEDVFIQKTGYEFWRASV